MQVRRVVYCRQAQKPYFTIAMAILKPARCSGHLIHGRLYCNPKALWKLNWFLRDFGCDLDLLDRDEVDERREMERDTKFVEPGCYLCEVRSGQYWRLEKLKSFDEFGVAEESVLPDVNPRTLAPAGEERAKERGLGQKPGVGQTGAEGSAELRLCNLVAQGTSDVEGGLQKGS